MERALAWGEKASFSFNAGLVAVLGADGVGNTTMRQLGNGSANSVADLIIVDLPRYHAEKRIAIQQIHQKFYVRVLRNFSAIFGSFKDDGGKTLTSPKKHLPQKTR